jgi:hypothetical protein
MSGIKIVILLFVYISLILFMQNCRDIPREPGARLVFEEENYAFGEIEDTLKISRVHST